MAGYGKLFADALGICANFSILVTNHSVKWKSVVHPPTGDCQVVMSHGLQAEYFGHHSIIINTRSSVWAASIAHLCF